MTDQPAPTLYGFWRSMAVYRVRVALALKGLRAHEIAVDLDAGEQFAADFLAVNPEGAVPTRRCCPRTLTAAPGSARSPP
jgi:glutathione S-transferase